MGQLQERITSTRGHSITSMQAIYVPADDYTDSLAPATTFAHLDATTELSREIALAVLPRSGSADLDQPNPRPALHRPEALRRRSACRPDSGNATRSCRTSSPSWASTSCPKKTRSWSTALVASSSSQPEHLHGREVHQHSRSTVPLNDAIESFRMVCDGEVDHCGAGLLQRGQHGGRRATLVGAAEGTGISSL